MKVMHRRRVARATRKCRLVALNVIHGAAKSVVAIGSTADNTRREAQGP